MVRHSTGLGGHGQVQLSPAQQQAWGALDQRLAKARSEGDQGTLVVVADSLISDCLWGHGLWAMPAAPLLTVALLGLLGWWLALGLRSGLQVPLVAGVLVVGVVLGHRRRKRLL